MNSSKFVAPVKHVISHNKIQEFVESGKAAKIRKSDIVEINIDEKTLFDIVDTANSSGMHLNCLADNLNMMLSKTIGHNATMKARDSILLAVAQKTLTSFHELYRIFGANNG